MTATRSVTFSCDHPLGCLAYATVAGEDLDTARMVLHEALHWTSDDRGDICPKDHIE